MRQESLEPPNFRSNTACRYQRSEGNGGALKYGMSTPERATLLRDIARSSDLRSEITSRMDDESYNLKARWEELEKLDLDIHRQIKVIFMKNKQSE